VDKLRSKPMSSEVSITDDIDATLMFREVQQFRQPWIWVVLSCSSLAALYVAAIPFVLDSDSEDTLVVHIILILFGIIFGVIFPILFYTTKLITEIRSDGLYLSFYPLLFSRIKIPFENIVKAEVKTYHPLREYGGWGIRHSPTGKAYNVSGNRGVQLELANGERILIGSHSPEQLARAIAFSRGR
jgi:hypothetical protein